MAKRGKRYQAAIKPINRENAYPLAEAVKLLKQGAKAKFDETVEIALNLGIDPRHADRIFRPFERLHSRDAFEGTGIGLAICQRIVQRHGGTIRADSEPGAGARFILHLPARQKDMS